MKEETGLTGTVIEKPIGPEAQWELTLEDMRVLKILELKESITASKVAEKLKISIKRAQEILEVLAKKQYAINYGATSSARSMWCAL